MGAMISGGAKTEPGSHEPRAVLVISVSYRTEILPQLAIPRAFFCGRNPRMGKKMARRQIEHAGVKIPFSVDITVRGLTHFSPDKVKIHQIAQTIHSSFCRENCPCPSHSTAPIRYYSKPIRPQHRQSRASVIPGTNNSWHPGSDSIKCRKTRWTTGIGNSTDGEGTLVAVETLGGFPVGYHFRLKWPDNW